MDLRLGFAGLTGMKRLSPSTALVCGAMVNNGIVIVCKEGLHKFGNGPLSLYQVPTHGSRRSPSRINLNIVPEREHTEARIIR